MSKARDIARAGTALSNVDATELGYLDGATSNIQAQLDSKTGGVAQPTEPSTPTDGLIWLDTDGTAPTSVITRWQKTGLAAGTTSLSGNDDNSLPLTYTPGYEQVFLNGALLSRGNDYTATSGTSITLTTGVVSGDLVEVICATQASYADTYTQTQANSTFTLNTNSNAAGKNAVINGGFDIWQRGTSFSGTVANTNTYSADRWVLYRDNFTFSRQTTSDTTNLPSIQYCMRVQRNSGQTTTSLSYLVYQAESVNSIPFAGKTVTLSFYARAGSNYSSTSNGLRAVVSTGTGTDSQRILDGFTGGVNQLDSTVTLTTTWQRFSITGTFATNITQYAIQFLMSGTGTAGTNDYYEITGVQLELGSIATTFARSNGSIQGELAACQRYYQVFNRDNMVTTGAAISTSAAIAAVQFMMEMRTSPTITLAAAGSGSGQMTFLTYTGNIPATIGSIGAQNITKYGFRIDATGFTAAFTAGDASLLWANSADVWKASAEL